VSNLDSASALFGAVSTDFGQTWTKRNVATGSDGLQAACCDGSVEFDSFGNLWMIYINSAISNIIVARSTNGGVSFSQIAAFGGSVDQPTITTGAGSVWVTYHSGSSQVARGAAVSGLGSAVSFGSAFTLPSSSGGNFGDIAIGPAGQVSVCWENPSGGETTASLVISTDPDGLGPSGFGAASAITSTNVGGFDFITPQNSRSVDAEIDLEYDRSGGPNNGKLYAMYTDESPDESNNTNIMLRTSDAQRRRRDQGAVPPARLGRSGQWRLLRELARLSQ
jgi:hypothetical protein